jgi:hypothetical protein
MKSTVKENDFLVGVKLTGHKSIYPVSRHTIKKINFPYRCLFSLSTSSQQENTFFLSVIISLTTGNHLKIFFPVGVKQPGKLSKIFIAFPV